MKSLNGFMIISVFLCAVMGALIWFYVAQPTKEKHALSDSFIVEPNSIDLEQDDTFFPVSKEKLPENIKSLTENYYSKVYSESKQTLEPGERLAQRTVLSYDLSKNLLKRTVYAAEGALSAEWIFKYNSAGKRISDENTWARPYVIYSHDDKGNMIGWKHYDGDGKLLSSAALKYDDKNVLVEQFRQNASGKGQKQYLYSYNRQGQKISRTEYSPSGYLRETFAYIYNEQGKLMEWVRMYRRGDIDDREVYSYNAHGYLGEKVTYLSGGWFRGKITYLHDDKGDLKEELRFTKPDSPFYKMTYEYDSENKLIKRADYIIWADPVTKKIDETSAGRTIFEYELYPK